MLVVARQHVFPRSAVYRHPHRRAARHSEAAATESEQRVDGALGERTAHDHRCEAARKEKRWEGGMS